MIFVLLELFVFLLGCILVVSLGVGYCWFILMIVRLLMFGWGGLIGRVKYFGWLILG